MLNFSQSQWSRVFVLGLTVVGSFSVSFFASRFLVSFLFSSDSGLITIPATRMRGRTAMICRAFCHHLYSFRQIAENADQVLFTGITNPSLCLMPIQQLLPFSRSSQYMEYVRGHSYTLPCQHVCYNCTKTSSSTGACLDILYDAFCVCVFLVSCLLSRFSFMRFCHLPYAFATQK